MVAFQCGDPPPPSLSLIKLSETGNKSKVIVANSSFVADSAGCVHEWMVKM